MSIVSSKDIQAGEEIFVSYNYDIQKSPAWYQVRAVVSLLLYYSWFLNFKTMVQVKLL